MSDTDTSASRMQKAHAKFKALPIERRREIVEGLLGPEGEHDERTARLLKYAGPIKDLLHDANEAHVLRQQLAEIGEAFDWLWGFWDGNTLVAARDEDQDDIQQALVSLANAIGKTPEHAPTDDTEAHCDAARDGLLAALARH